jgi:hypothetical protein
MVSAVRNRVLPSPRSQLDQRPEIDGAGPIEQVCGRVDDERGVRRDDAIGEVGPSVETQKVPEIRERASGVGERSFRPSPSVSHGIALGRNLLRTVRFRR